MQRTYELMFIVRPDMPEEDQDKLISNLETQVGSAGGTVKSVERMGKRRLAYIVRKFQDGIYMLMILEGEGAMVKEVERRLRVTEPVIKFITVRDRRRAEAAGQDQGHPRHQGPRQGTAGSRAAAAELRQKPQLQRPEARPSRLASGRRIRAGQRVTRRLWRAGRCRDSVTAGANDMTIDERWIGW